MCEYQIRSTNSVSLGTLVTVIFLDPGHRRQVIGSGSDAAAAESAAREAQVLHQLRHPHIVPLRSDES